MCKCLIIALIFGLHEGEFGGGVGFIKGYYFMSGITGFMRGLSPMWENIFEGENISPILSITGIKGYVYIKHRFKLGIMANKGLTRASVAFDTLYYSCLFSIDYWTFLMEYSPVRQVGFEMIFNIGLGTGNATLNLLKIRRLPCWEEICENEEDGWGSSELYADFGNLTLGIELLFPIISCFKIGLGGGLIYSKIPFGSWYLHRRGYRVPDSKGVNLEGFTFTITIAFDRRNF